MRTLPVHLDRLDAALKAKGVTLKRHSLMEVAASAFGYVNQNQLTAAARKGDLDVPAVHGVGLIAVGGRQVAVLEDGDGRIFAVDAHRMQARERADAFVVSPYGGIMDLRQTGELPDLRTGGRMLHFASITHEYGSDLYCDPTEEGLKKQVADWCRRYWNQEGVDGSYEGLSDEETCEAYFEHTEEDGVTYFDTADVSIPASTVHASRMTPHVPEDFDMTGPYVVMRTTDDVDEPTLFWSNEDGWVDSLDATVFDSPQALPLLGIDPGTVSVVPLPREIATPIVRQTTTRPYLNRDGKGLDIVFLTNRECDVQGPEDEAKKAMPWIEADDMEVGLGPVRAAEIGYAALVEGEIYLAPTIKAFHFDAENPVRAMQKNSHELQSYATAIEPAIRAVGGMAMLEEDPEAVMLTILVPLSEARRAADMECWKEALQDLLTPGGSGPRILARFRPQKIVGDGCYDADALGSDLIDVTYELKLMGHDAIVAMEDSEDEAERLKDAVRSPEWIRAWEGPFGIDVREAAADHYGFDPYDL